MIGIAPYTNGLPMGPVFQGRISGLRALAPETVTPIPSMLLVRFGEGTHNNPLTKHDRSAFLKVGLPVAGLTAAGAIALAAAGHLWALLLLLPSGAYATAGLQDVTQTQSTLRRNFPIVARIRYLLEGVRDELQEYIVKNKSADKDPYSIDERARVYAASKGEGTNQPFGTKLDVTKRGHEAIIHSIHSNDGPKTESFMTIGGPQCRKPYTSSRINISGMSHGALSGAAIRAFNRGAKLGGFIHNTGEGGVAPYHLGLDVNMADVPQNSIQGLVAAMQARGEDPFKEAGDLCYQIGTGYFGCRAEDGTFDAEKFQQLAAFPNIKLIELKLSQGAKPGGGGILPAAKVTPEIAKVRGVPLGKDVLSPATHSAFETPVEMLQFLQQLRDLSGGKPVGFKLCIGYKHEFLAICKAMVQTGITPDFITIDGSEGGTGAAPHELTDHAGMPLRPALLFAQNALVGFGLRDQIRLIVSGKIVDGFDIAHKLALGADGVNVGRGMMFAQGCIQARQCNTNACPTGITTHDPKLTGGLDVTDKGQRVANYHHALVKSLNKITGIAGLNDPGQLRPSHFMRNVEDGKEPVLLSEYHEFIAPGSLLAETTIPASFKTAMAAAQAESFEPRPFERVGAA